MQGLDEYELFCFLKLEEAKAFHTVLSDADHGCEHFMLQEKAAEEHESVQKDAPSAVPI